MKVIKEQAETYEELEKALEDGKKIQLCTINTDGSVFEWHDQETVKRAFPPNRFRIIKD